MFTASALRGQSAGWMCPDIIALKTRETVRNTNRVRRLQFLCRKLKLVKIIKLITKYREKPSLPIHMFISLRSYFPNYQNVFNLRCICTFNIVSLHLVDILKTGSASSSETPVHMYQGAMHTSVLYKNKQSMCDIFFFHACS